MTLLKYIVLFPQLLKRSNFIKEAIQLSFKKGLLKGTTYSNIVKAHDKVLALNCK